MTPADLAWTWIESPRSIRHEPGERRAGAFPQAMSRRKVTEVTFRYCDYEALLSVLESVVEPAVELESLLLPVWAEPFLGELAERLSVV